MIGAAMLEHMNVAYAEEPAVENAARLGPCVPRPRCREVVFTASYSARRTPP